MTLLSVRDLVKHFPIKRGVLPRTVGHVLSSALSCPIVRVIG